MNDRKHLVSAKMKKLMVATKESRNEICDKCLLSLMFRHGLRAHSTICGAPKIKLVKDCMFLA
jgi:type 1 fimbriae regulatory protein FimB